jgi:hypothetical protein
MFTCGKSSPLQSTSDQLKSIETTGSIHNYFIICVSQTSVQQNDAYEHKTYVFSSSDQYDIVYIIFFFGNGKNARVSLNLT